VRRVDRLFQIVEIIRSRRITTAKYLSERLELSSRTIYRHILDLQLVGIPINSEPSKGFSMDPSFSMSPISFTDEELEALAFGTRLVQVNADPALAGAALEALTKIRAVLPPPKRRAMEDVNLFPAMAQPIVEDAKNLGLIRKALKNRVFVELFYVDQYGNVTAREVRPLGLSFWGQNWTLAAWCELRCDFRVFRLDRVQSVGISVKHFNKEADKSWEEFLRATNWKGPKIP